MKKVLIRAKTGLSRNAIRKYLRDENAEPRYRMTARRGSLRLLDHEVHLRAMYEGDLGKPARERRSLQGLYEAQRDLVFPPPPVRNFNQAVVPPRDPHPVKRLLILANRE